MHGFLALQIIFLEFLHDLLRCNLTLLLGNLLDDICEFLVHTLWQLEAIEGIHDKGHAALSGLAVDTHDWLVLPADIAGIDRKIWNLPVLSVSLMKGLHTLVDGILMGTGKCSEHQLAGIGMSGRNIHLGAALTYICNLTDILNVKFRVDSL